MLICLSVCPALRGCGGLFFQRWGLGLLLVRVDGTAFPCGRLRVCNPSSHLSWACCDAIVCALLCCQGADPSVVTDPLYWLNPDTKVYEPLDARTYMGLCNMSSKL